MKLRILLRIFLPMLVLQLALTPASGQESARKITLEDALRLFLENNIELRGQELEIAKARGHKKTAGLWSNPTVSYEREDLSLGDIEEGEEVIGLELELDLFFKRSLRKKSAEYGLGAAEAHFARYRAEGIAELKSTYALTLLAQRRVELLRETAEVFETAQTTGVARLEEGDISEFDQMRLAAEGDRYRRELATAQLEYESLQRELGVLIAPVLDSPGSSHEEPVSAERIALYEPAGALIYSPMELTLDQALEMALLERMDLRGAHYEAKAANESVRLAKRERLPGFTLFGGYKSQSDDLTGTVFEIGMDLPIFDRNQGEIAAGRAELLQAEGRANLLRREIRAQVESAYSKVQALAALVQAQESESAPESGEILEIARVGYLEGEMSLLGLLDAAEAGYERDAARDEILAEYMIGLAELESAMGGSLK
jgi:cobalt-zinc-cadmium efflux system outer membrane protein